MSNQMSIFDFAKMLNGRQRLEEITAIEERRARELGFIVLFGYSDDCAEFRGAYDDEVECFDGGRVYIDGDLFIDAIWCKGNADWTYKTNIPHATFDIFDDGELYCRGIVFEKHANRPENPTKPKDERPEEISNSFSEIQSDNKIDDTSEWIGHKVDFDDPYPILIKSDYLVCKNCGNHHFLRIPVYDKMRACTLFDIPLRVPKHCSECGKKMRNA